MLIEKQQRGACYISKTGHHFSTCVRERLSSDKLSHIFQHIQSSERCCQSFSADCLEILDSTPTKYQLKLKEAMCINWEKPNLNHQVHQVHQPETFEHFVLTQIYNQCLLLNHN